jgi:chemotaxis regulatin CheY-phosphate phosphatase CheZ
MPTARRSFGGAAMKPKPPRSKIVDDIETRQEEVLRQLDELNSRLEQALAELGIDPHAKLPSLDQEPLPDARAA